MKIFVVGDGRSEIHEVGVVNAFRKLGHQVEFIFWHHYFESNNKIVSIWRKIQNKFLIGPDLIRLNQFIILKIVQSSPDLIFFYRGTHIFPRTLIELKRNLPDCLIYGYNNDDPFAPNQPPWLWRNFINCVSYYDLMFAYRPHNVDDYIGLGVKNVKLLMPWFIPDKDFPLKQNESVTIKYDVCFIGHYEHDGRLEFLEKIANSNFTLGLFGPDWNLSPNFNWLIKYRPIFPMLSDSYRETLLSSKIALCFLSSRNRDKYTRRCFEIPAMGVFMLCQYSIELSQLFKDGVEAVFFHNPGDMIEKIAFYLKNDHLREQIAANGRSRVLRDRHDIVSRMEYVLNQMNEMELR